MASSFPQPMPQSGCIVFTEGDELYDHMLAAIRSAERSVRLESYIFADDEVGRAFVEALAERARAGVDVRVHLDAFGSFLPQFSNADEQMEIAGVKLKWFRPLAWRSFAYLNHRNHRKLLVVDERCAYLGGFNIHRESSRRAVGAERWRDSQLGFTGALAEEAARIFDLLWRGDRAWQMAKPDEAGTYLLSNHSWRNRRRLWRVFAYRFRRAHKRIYLTTPYFMPDSRTQHELMLAARRGVDVKLLLPGKKSDRWLTRYAARAAYRRLLDAGVQIFEYLPRMLHAKTVTIDGNWATIGTANMDYRSFFVNFELNLVTRNKALCEHLEHDFANDLRDSAAIDSARWGMRNRLARLIERFAWSIRRWM